jgi:hypothetical protein
MIQVRILAAEQQHPALHERPTAPAHPGRGHRTTTFSDPESHQLPVGRHRRERPPPRYVAGRMLLLRWKRLSGSYFALIRASRTYLVP